MLLAASLAGVDWSAVSRLETRRYGAQYLDRTEAAVPWRVFCERLPVIFAGPRIGDLEIVAVRKSVTWSDRDFNVYMGSANAGRQIQTFLDLSCDEFRKVFGWHLDVARALSSMLSREVYVTHGFNPEDNSPDAHSITNRFHTHVHVPQEDGRRAVSRRDLSTFHRLALIEPFSDVFFDRAAGVMALGSDSQWRPERRFGFFTMSASLTDAAREFALGQVYSLLSDLRRAYRQVVDAFTDGAEEAVTGCARKVPRPRGERVARVARVVRANDSWLSDRSAELLMYVARHLEAAEPRESSRSTRIASAGQVWLAKGFSGVLNFVVSARADIVRCDFAPRVVSTSGAAKVIGPGPTLVFKDQGAASAQDQRRMEEFLEAAAEAAQAIETDGITWTSYGRMLGDMG